MIFDINSKPLKFYQLNMFESDLFSGEQKVCHHEIISVENPFYMSELGEPSARVDPTFCARANSRSRNGVKASRTFLSRL